MKKVIYLIITFLLLNQIDAQSIDHEEIRENQYRVLSKKLVSIVNKIDSIPFVYEKIYNRDGREILKANFRKRNDFIEKNEEVIKDIEEDFKDYINQNKNNDKWVDDAIFSLIGFYTLLNQGEKLYTDSTIMYLKMLIELEDRVHIEKYTYNLFNKTSISWFLKDIPEEEWTRHMSIDKRLIQYCYRNIIGELLRANRYEDAERELKNLKSRIVKENLAIISELMNSWLEIKQTGTVLDEITP